MAMTPGNVAIADDGAETKTGFAGSHFDLLMAQYAARLASNGQPTPPLSVLVGVKRGFAEVANNSATLIAYIQANGTAGGDPIL